MIIFKRGVDLTNWLEKQRAAGQKIGFVPTMGALHQGHISLITISKKNTSLTVCSIFVNPTQFNDPRDFQKYPITIEKDMALLEQAGTDVLFLPEVSELYPGGTAGLEQYDLGKLETLLEGKFRPGHFQGVCQVMNRLLTIVRPDELFMGSKDYQQCMVVQRLLDSMKLPTTLDRCPIVREPDGLAMSSRNVRLTPEQRSHATAIYQALLGLRDGWSLDKATAHLEAAGFRIDYIALADPGTLEPVDTETRQPAGTGIRDAGPGTREPATPGRRNIVALIAAFMGEVRLIDNLTL